MEQTANESTPAATDEPAVPSACAAHATHPPVTAHAPSGQQLIEQALACGADIRPGHAVRHDGWTPEAIGTFLEALAECGCVNDAAKAAGLSARSAYRLRSSTKGRAFHLAWDAAILLARRRLADALLSRALHGHVRTITRDGKPWGEEHNFDNRLSMAMLTRLDRLAESSHDLHTPARFAAEEFSQFVAIACAEGNGAVDFVQSRLALGIWGHWEAQVLERADNYRDYGVGMAEEIDVSDLDLEDKGNWTEGQARRAHRAGLLGDDAGRRRGNSAAAAFIRRLVR